MDISVQINYSSPQSGNMTQCNGGATCLDVARALHEKGARVGSVAVYDYDANEDVDILVGIWYGSEETYFGNPKGSHWCGAD